MDLIKQNVTTIANELNWLGKILDKRFELYFQQKNDNGAIFLLKPPELQGEKSIYADFIREHKFGFYERLVLALAIAPHIKPQMLDVFFTKNSSYDRGFSEFGGVKGESHGGFIPTGETLAFILAANDFETRFRLMQLFDPEHAFAKKNILKIHPVIDHEPFFSGILQLDEDFIDLFTVGKVKKPTFNSKFPAHLIRTELTWDDLILEDQILDQVNEIISWIKYKDTILNTWELHKKIKPGYRTLFYGPPGTGKTFTAGLIGKTIERDVYKVDLSMVVSKWVGETEKNLSRVFDMAENKDWILFFDEADALFGKRTDTKSSQEKYANQEVSYLLQRTEEFSGTVILASNLKGNMDEAFTRRFQSMIFFPMPKAKERLKIWEKAFNGGLKLHKEVDLKKIAQDYELSGGGIINVLRYCAIKALERHDHLASQEDIITGIKREFSKEGKTF
ncbi:MAG: ATP-binding protein [Saprospiraceae bacterium]|nr:ATP-binding protein [Saprospiraceae bacterium]